MLSYCATLLRSYDTRDMSQAIQRLLYASSAYVNLHTSRCGVGLSRTAVEHAVQLGPLWSNESTTSLSFVVFEFKRLFAIPQTFIPAWRRSPIHNIYFTKSSNHNGFLIRKGKQSRCTLTSLEAAEEAHAKHLNAIIQNDNVIVIGQLQNSSRRRTQGQRRASEETSTTTEHDDVSTVVAQPRPPIPQERFWNRRRSTTSTAQQQQQHRP
eukprot:scaffold333_cov133-Cylindrotheca_fusiformis.AAC.25